jgi:hypothetical protein
VANPNSIADVINRQNNGQPIVITSANTLHQSFQLGQSAALLTIPNPMAPINTPNLFPNFSPQARPFIIRAAGTVQGGEKYQIDIVQGLNLTPVLASTGLATNGLTADNFMLEAECMWDAQSQLLRCIYYGWVGNTQVSQGAVINSISVATFASLQFNVALTLATANVNASVALTEFSAEMV